MNSSGRTNISDAYDYRVALPLAVVVILGLMFVDISGHKPTTFKSASSSSSVSKKPVNHQALPSVNSATNLPKLSQTVNTVDLNPNESPTDIQTVSPQSSGSGSTAGTNSGSELQNPNNGSSSVTASQPSQADIENLINGIPGFVNNISNNASNGLKNTINLLR